MNSNQFWFLRWMFWAAMVTVTVMSLLPGAYLPPVAFSVWDKAQHAFGFWLLGVLGLWSYPRISGRVVFGLLLYGAAIELTQAATGWRHGDWQDWIANAVGVAAAYGLWRGFRSTSPTTRGAGGSSTDSTT